MTQYPDDIIEEPDQTPTLAERLRAVQGFGVWRIAAEAADEIDRLTAALSVAERSLQGARDANVVLVSDEKNAVARAEQAECDLASVALALGLSHEAPAKAIVAAGDSLREQLAPLQALAEVFPTYYAAIQRKRDAARKRTEEVTEES